MKRLLKESVQAGADVVVKKQKELIAGKSSKFAGAISKTAAFIDKDKNVTVNTGYTMQSVRKHGIGGIVMEYGRPGAKRGGKTKRKSKNGGYHEMRIGKIDATPHIRKGYDAAIEEAVETTVNDLLEVIKL